MTPKRIFIATLIQIVFNLMLIVWLVVNTDWIVTIPLFVIAQLGAWFNGFTIASSYETVIRSKHEVG